MATFQHNAIETTIIHEEPTERLEMALLHHSTLIGTPTFVIASYPTQDNPNQEPSERVELTIEQARLLRDLLNRSEVTTLLDEQLIHA